MKKLKHIFHRTVASALLVLILIAFACQDNKVDPVFHKSPAERSLESINSLRELLKASEDGWIVSYKPSKNETGSYQFVFKFLKDSIVEAASDFSQNDLNPVRSEYTVLQGSTTKLSFSTFGALHRLSDSDFSPIPGDRGAGLKGDFEFLYYGQNAGGDLIFRTNRTQDTVIFRKSTPGALNDLAQSYANLGRLTGRRSVYRTLQETNGNKIVKSAFDLPYDARVIMIQSVEQMVVGATLISSYYDGYVTGYGLTPQGIFLDSVKLSNGSFIKNVAFSYDATRNRFAATLKGGAELSIGDADGPIVPVNGQKFMLDPTLTSSLAFFYGDEDLGGLTTPEFNRLFEKVSDIGLAPRFSFAMQVTYNGTKIDFISMPGTASVTNSTVRPLLVFEDKGDRLVMKRNGFRDPDSVVKPANEALYNEFMDFITDPEGFYVENLGRVTRYSNLIFTFTSVKDPSVRFGMYHVAR
ncbi:DUF4302 domain-containing protein [Chryseolinea lacunae]|uniref:DUF4302 domain-containing protein n=1 Tax=Chryseolinea lacunae TaxID=2801331 RepID=A0ABS1KNC4_9BACT|nr:DUF4302 domain-containing protein [Chryseolinea lacunae]MBL0740747.1 DUF4302 domain-containing protein [Chryseolinea lacunae]